MTSRKTDLYAYVGTGTEPAHNLAIEEYITMHTGPDDVVLYLWQNSHTIVIGRNQNLAAEVRVSDFEKDGGTIVRRLSGGGAVYHDMGNLNFTFCVRRGHYDVDRQLTVILNAVRSFGIDAEKTGRNDLTADGRKFSGNAFYRSGDYCYHHGTLMVDCDPDQMKKYLSPSKAKLASKGVKSVKSRVVNLNELSDTITVEALTEALIEAFGDVYGGEVRHYEFPAGAEAEIAEETLKFSSPEWVRGHELDGNYSRKHRFDWGEAEIRIETDGEEVKDCVIYSDAMDQDFINKAREALMNTEFDECAMSESILAVPVDKDKVVMRDDLAKLFS